MKRFCKAPRVTFLLPPIASMNLGGTGTFIRQLSCLRLKHPDLFRVVELSPAEALKRIPVVATLPKLQTTHNRESAVRLGLGYVQELWRWINDIVRVRAQLGSGIIVTNDFGCEVGPVALRLVKPFSRIVAISHTHPGQTKEARHWVRRWVERLCYWFVSDILFNSNSSRLEWACKLGVREIKGRVVPLGTNVPDLSLPQDYPKKPAGVIDFVCVARFVGWKGQSNLVDAWAKVVAGGVRNVRLVLVGDGPTWAAVQQQVMALGLTDQVLLLGARPQAGAYFNGADAALLMSREPEAFGLVLLEAMSRKVPVLASRLGGIPEIVQDGVTGLLVDPEDTMRIAESVCRLVSDEGLRRQLGANGYARWESEFTSEHMLSRYYHYFNVGI